MAESEDYKPRTDVKPLHIVQPEGVSFKMTGNELEWQKWKMHIGSFDHCPAVAYISYIPQDSRSVKALQSLLLPIMIMAKFGLSFIAYLSQKWSYHTDLLNIPMQGSSLLTRKHLRIVPLMAALTFLASSGEYGIGTVANELSLGCDCLGKIHYLVCLDIQISSSYRSTRRQPGVLVAHDGKPHVIKNAICIHEEDAGVLWKHTDFRPGGRSQTVRRRRLVVSMVCTVANYGKYYFLSNKFRRIDYFV